MEIPTLWKPPIITHISNPDAPWCWNIYLHLPGKYTSTMEHLGHMSNIYCHGLFIENPTQIGDLEVPPWLIGESSMNLHDLSDLHPQPGRGFAAGGQVRVPGPLPRGDRLWRGWPCGTLDADGRLPGGEKWEQLGKRWAKGGEMLMVMTGYSYGD